MWCDLTLVAAREVLEKDVQLFSFDICLLHQAATTVRTPLHKVFIETICLDLPDATCLTQVLQQHTELADYAVPSFSPECSAYSYLIKSTS